MITLTAKAAKKFKLNHSELQNIEGDTWKVFLMFF
jgi:hypothetical protein